MRNQEYSDSNSIPKISYGAKYTETQVRVIHLWLRSRPPVSKFRELGYSLWNMLFFFTS